MPPTARVFAALVAGLALGAVAAAGESSALLALARVAEPVGTLWVNGIRMTVVPLVVSLLVTGIAAAGSGSAGRVGGRTLLLFAALVAASAAFGALAAPPLVGLVPLDAQAAAALRGSVPGGAAASVELPPFRDWLTGLVPPNPVRAAADAAMLPLIVFTAVFAFALTRTAAEHRDALVRFFRAVAEAMFVVVGWILLLAPLGVFCLVFPLAARTGAQLAGAVGAFLLVVCGLTVVSIAALYPLAALAGGVPLRRFARAAAPAQAVAFSTRSSLASLPALVEGAERRLGLPAHVTGLVLPAAVAVLKFASPIVRIAETLFVARLYGIGLGAGELAAVAAAVGALSFYSPGIPSGGLFVLAPVYLEFGLPVEGIALLIALDVIPDMFLTTANVTADLAVAAIVGRGAGAAREEPAAETPGPAAA
ncbi:MAG TPA: cation:dicarboxylase symporter family transporter [Longimicrobium sp.]|jgi:Na+/H+-dicarboxylate symporter